jgi:hypothetical protein
MKKDLDLGWFDLKKTLQNADKKELINLIRDLYRLSEENRRYLLAGSMDTKAEPGILEAYREVIKNEFFPEKGHGTLRYSVAEKAINSYSKASGDLEGTVELMLFYVENGVDFTNEYGDIDEKFYDKIVAMLEKFCNLLKTPEGKALYPRFKKRLFEIRKKTKGIGWGFGDEVNLLVKDIEDFFEKEQRDS